METLDSVARQEEVPAEQRALREAEAAAHRGEAERLQQHHLLASTIMELRAHAPPAPSPQTLLGRAASTAAAQHGAARHARRAGSATARLGGGAGATRGRELVGRIAREHEAQAEWLRAEAAALGEELEPSRRAVAVMEAAEVEARQRGQDEALRELGAQQEGPEALAAPEAQAVLRAAFDQVCALDAAYVARLRDAAQAQAGESAGELSAAQHERVAKVLKEAAAGGRAPAWTTRELRRELPEVLPARLDAHVALLQRRKFGRARRGAAEREWLAARGQLLQRAQRELAEAVAAAARRAAEARVREALLERRTDAAGRLAALRAERGAARAEQVRPPPPLSD